MTSVGVADTAVGQGLFDFGHRDGAGGRGAAAAPARRRGSARRVGRVADTYNGAVRRYDPATRRSPPWRATSPSPATCWSTGDTLVVVESAAHRLVRVADPRVGARVDGRGAPRPARPDRPRTRSLALRVAFAPPTGQHLDDRFGDPTQLTVAASPPELLTAGAGTAPGLARELVLGDVAEGVLQVSVAAAACDEGDAVFAACHRYQQDWGIPVRLVPGAAAELCLDLRAVD